MRSGIGRTILVFLALGLLWIIPNRAWAQDEHEHDHPDMRPVEGRLRAEYVIQARFDPRLKRIIGVVEITSRDTTLWGSATLEISVPERGTRFDSVFYRGQLLDSVAVPFRGGQTVIHLADTIVGPQPFYIRIVYSCPWILHGWSPKDSGAVCEVPFSRWCPQLKFSQAVPDARESYRAAITVDKQYHLYSPAELMNEAEHYGPMNRGDGIDRSLHAFEGTWNSDDRLYLYRADRVTDFSLVWTSAMTLDRIRAGDSRLDLLYPASAETDRYDRFLTAYQELLSYLLTKVGERERDLVFTVIFSDMDQPSFSSGRILTMPDKGRSDMELILLSAYSLVGDRLSRVGFDLTGNTSFPLVGRDRNPVYSPHVSFLEALQGYYLTDLIDRQYGMPGLKALKSYLTSRPRGDTSVTVLVDGAARLRIMANAVGEDRLDAWIDSVLVIVAREEDPEQSINRVTDSMLGATGRSLWDQWSSRPWVCNYQLRSAEVVPGVSILKASFHLHDVMHRNGLRTPFELGLTYPNGDREIVSVAVPISEEMRRFEVDIPVDRGKPEFVVIDPRGRLPLLNRETAYSRLSYYHPYPPEMSGWYPAFEILVDRLSR